MGPLHSHLVSRRANPHPNHRFSPAVSLLANLLNNLVHSRLVNPVYSHLVNRQASPHPNHQCSLAPDPRRNHLVNPAHSRLANPQSLCSHL